MTRLTLMFYLGDLGITIPRSNILDAGTGFDTQKQFLANIEDAITSPLNSPGRFDRYERVLQYAGGPLNFTSGRGLYLMPSDLQVYPGNYPGNNNEIQIAGADAAIGLNSGINKTEPVTSVKHKCFQGKVASSARTVHKRLQPSVSHATVNEAIAKNMTETKMEPGTSALDHEEGQGRGRPSCPLAITLAISTAIANSVWPREEESPQQWPWPTNSLQASCLPL